MGRLSRFFPAGVVVWTCLVVATVLEPRAAAAMRPTRSPRMASPSSFGGSPERSGSDESYSSISSGSVGGGSDPESATRSNLGGSVGGSGGNDNDNSRGGEEQDLKNHPAYHLGKREGFQQGLAHAHSLGGGGYNSVQGMGFNPRSMPGSPYGMGAGMGSSMQGNNGGMMGAGIGGMGGMHGMAGMSSMGGMSGMGGMSSMGGLGVHGMGSMGMNGMGGMSGMPYGSNHYGGYPSPGGMGGGFGHGSGAMGSGYGGLPHPPHHYSPDYQMMQQLRMQAYMPMTPMQFQQHLLMSGSHHGPTPRPGEHGYSPQLAQLLQNPALADRLQKQGQIRNLIANRGSAGGLTQESEQRRATSGSGSQQSPNTQQSGDDAPNGGDRTSRDSDTSPETDTGISSDKDSSSSARTSSNSNSERLNVDETDKTVEQTQSSENAMEKQQRIQDNALHDIPSLERAEGDPTEGLDWA